MGRIRTIKPEFSAHEELSELPAETHLFAAALLTYADDEGYFNANPVLLKAGTTPLRDKDGTKLEEQLVQLERIGYIELRRDGAKAIGLVVRFSEHQRVSHPTPSKLRMKFESLPKNSGDVREPLRPEGKGKELKGTGKGKEQSAPEAREVFEIPEWVDRQAFDRFIAMRKKNRKPVADAALPLLVQKLDALRRAGNDPTSVLDQSTLNGWQGLFEVKRDGANQQARSGAAVGIDRTVAPQDATGTREATLGYWRAMRDKGIPRYAVEAPQWVKAELEETA